jgi:ABC-type transport system involved in multi-copper enzyme maturation permease subunit
MLFGPLAGPECRRAVARGWLMLVRALAAVAMLGVVLIIVWWWWVSQLADPDHQPYNELRVGLLGVEVMMLAIALVQGPAVLAGSIAGEKQRGVLALLMTTRVNSWEVVLGRLVGKLSQVVMILLAGVPALVFLASMAGMRFWALVALLAVPVAVSIGAGGLAALASTLSRRGRDALLAVYFVDLLFLLTPMLRRAGWTAGPLDWLPALNPFECTWDLVWSETVSVAAVTVALWLTIGIASATLAAWRLRPACLAAAAGEVPARGGRRRAWVPPVDEDRPMLWKELFVERVATLGRFGRWVGLVLTTVLAAGSIWLTAMVVLGHRLGSGAGWDLWARTALAEWVGGTAAVLGFLIEWAVGLRASVSISSERERGSWDALLTSPLEAKEIVRGKLWGSLYALRWLIAATFLAWTLAAATGAESVSNTVSRMAEVLVVGAFMAAVGVRTSLACNTATRAMAVTIGAWLGAYVASGLIAGLTLLLGVLMCNTAWILLSQVGLLQPLTALWLPLPGTIAWPVARNFPYLVATALVVADTRLRFDRIAGRMTGGAVAVAVDEMIYGRPEAPVPVQVEESATTELA